MLTLQSIRQTYGKKEVLKGVSLEFPEGSISGIIGLNGAGKTTLLNSIKGHVIPDEGQLLWKGQPVGKQQVSFLEIQNYFYSNITGKEYLQLFRAQNPLFEVEKWNQLFQLPLGQLVEGYSTGMKKKLAIMGMLSLERPILLLDEPYNGLDLGAGLQLQQVLMALKETGKTILLTSHVLESLLPICDTISWLHEGTIWQTFEKEGFASIRAKLEEVASKESESLIKGLLLKS